MISPPDLPQDLRTHSPTDTSPLENNQRTPRPTLKTRLDELSELIADHYIRLDQFEAGRNVILTHLFRSDINPQEEEEWSTKLMILEEYERACQKRIVGHRKQRTYLREELMRSVRATSISGTRLTRVNIGLSYIK